MPDEDSGKGVETLQKIIVSLVSVSLFSLQFPEWCHWNIIIIIIIIINILIFIFNNSEFLKKKILNRFLYLTNFFKFKYLKDKIFKNKYKRENKKR